MTSDALRHQIIKLQRNNSLQNVVCVCVCVGLFFYCLTVRTQSHSCIWKKLCFFFPVLASAPEVLGTHPFESRVERLDALIVIFFCEYPQKPISYQRSRLSPFTSRIVICRALTDFSGWQIVLELPIKVTLFVDFSSTFVATSMSSSDKKQILTL